MLAPALLATLLLAQSSAMMSQACSGAVATIDSVAVNDVQNNGDTENYALRGSVTNHSSRRQAAKVLQSIDVTQDGQKINEIGIPPLRPGQSYQFHQSVTRSSIAGRGTTHLNFLLEMHKPQSCTESSAYHLRI
jgi:hypothetical protein